MQNVTAYLEFYSGFENPWSDLAVSDFRLANELHI